jgi:hypothetical protein
MKYNNIVTTLWITVVVPVATFTSVDGSDVIVTDVTLLKEENGILDTPHPLTNAAVLDQKTQMSNGNEVSNASLFNKQGQFKSNAS